MSLFEDLVDELKEDNLLEETIIESAQVSDKNEIPKEVRNELEEVSPPKNLDENNFNQKLENEAKDSAEGSLIGDSEDAIKSFDIKNESYEYEKVDTSEDDFESKIVDVSVGNFEAEIVDPAEGADYESEIVSIADDEIKKTSEPKQSGNHPQTETKALDESILAKIKALDESIIAENNGLKEAAVAETEQEVLKVEFANENIDSQNLGLIENETAHETEHKSEYYRRKAMDEVNGLEMVDHILCGVEREIRKEIPTQFDNNDTKDALYDFLQVAEDANSPQYSALESGLMKETEKWYSSLAKRDRIISVGELRRYCESTKPSVSSQALMSLARFYRNSPFSETVRGKFDLVVSKLFSKDIEDGRRELVFEADELIQHVKELYADWSSVKLYSEEEDDSEILLAAIKFQDFMAEAESAETFDRLVKTDFFKRIKVFKEKTHENFFAPTLVAAAVEGNVAIGNRFIELICQERDIESDGSLSEKYGEIHDKAISDATSKSLELVEILERKKVKSQVSKPKSKQSTEENDSKSNKAKPNKKGKKRIIALLFIIALIGLTIGAVYYFTNNTSPEEITSTEQLGHEEIINLETSTLREFIVSAKIKYRTAYAVTNEKWMTMTFEGKQELVKKIIMSGEERGFDKVELLNSEGQTVAFGSKNGINIVQ